MSGGAIQDYFRLLRPKQWAKGLFVIIGPMYGLAWRVHPPLMQADQDAARIWQILFSPVMVALWGVLIAFSLTSSAGYILNDLRDAPLDRLHPRKQSRPIAAGRVSPTSAGLFAAGLLVLAAAALGLVYLFDPRAAVLAGLAVLMYVLNVAAYSGYFKHRPVLDVMSLSGGFVLRVLGGCAATLVEPSSWLLNCTLFISMFLALGKRLGERRTMGSHDAAVSVRSVQASYTDDTLRMLVVMTAVACLVSYSDYVQAKAADYTSGFNLLWLTLVPAVYAIFRAVLLLERGVYDDPTELAMRDRAFQLATGVFIGLTAALMSMKNAGVFAG